MSLKAVPQSCSAGSPLVRAKLRYDPMGRLHEVEAFSACGVTQGVTRFLYDGDALIAEYNGSGTMLARYIHGPAAGADDPLAAYAGSGVAATDRTNLYADARGSIVMRTGHDGSSATINTYDEYGIPGSSNTGRFQYTGQVWLAELGMNYYKARMYSPQLGRFMQTDPIGYEDNVNLYGYVGNDPINGVDFMGLCDTGSNIKGSGGGTSTCKTLDGFQKLSKEQTPAGFAANSKTVSPGSGLAADGKPSKLKDVGASCLLLIACTDSTHRDENVNKDHKYQTERHVQKPQEKPQPKTNRTLPRPKLSPRNPQPRGPPSVSQRQLPSRITRAQVNRAIARSGGRMVSRLGGRLLRTAAPVVILGYGLGLIAPAPAGGGEIR